MRIMMPSLSITPDNISELLEDGILSCVLKQDWSVNRIAPDFLNAQAFREFIAGDKTLLHLGIGNGECYKYFDDICDLKQMSISDKLYFDPLEIIGLYVQKCGFSGYFANELSDIMRNEFLIAISYENLYTYNKNHYTHKDLLISDMLKSIYDHSKSYSFNVITLLLHLLNTRPQMLFPNSLCEQRIVTPMGQKIVICRISNLEYADITKKCNKVITLNNVKEYLVSRFANIGDIVLADFMSLNLKDYLGFDYILATRSDAFLKKNYFEFVFKITRFLNPNGFYISDGIVSCYNYELFYQDLMLTASIIGENRVFLVCALDKSYDVPLRDIVGIVVLGEKCSINNIYKFINPKQIIPFCEATNNEYFIRQCAWTDFIEWAGLNSFDLESIDSDRLLTTLDQYIAEKEISNNSFSIFESICL